MSKIRVALIGTGMICNSAHIPALKDLQKEGVQPCRAQPLL